MAITTLDGLIAGLKPPECFVKVTGTLEAIGQFHSLFYTAGRPGAAVAPTPGLAGAALTSYAGQIPFQGAVGGQNIHLARFEGAISTPGKLILADRLWHNSGIVVTTTTAQTINSAAWPARDAAGSTNGEGIHVALEVSTATTNAGAITNMTMSYTNQAGVAGRTATMSSFPATAVAGTFAPFILQAGDTGVRSIQSLTLGTSLAAGTVHLVAFRIITSLNVAVPNVGGFLDAVSSGMPRMYDNSVPFIVLLPTATTAVNICGQVVYTQG